MSRRALIAVALLLVAAVVEAFAYYVAYDHAFVWAAFVARTPSDCVGGTSPGLSFDTSHVSRWWSLASTLGAGGLAITIGPRRTAMLAAVIAASALVLVACGGPLALAAIAMAIGTGAFRPCLLAAQTEVLDEKTLGRRRFFALGVVALVSGAAFDGARLVAGRGASLLLKHTSDRTVTLAGAALFLAVAVLCVGADILVRRARVERDVARPDTVYRSAHGHGREPSAGLRTRSRAFVGIAMLAPMMLVVCMGFTIELPYDAVRHGIAWYLHPLLRFGFGLAFAALGLVMLRRELTWPPLAIFALALMAYGAGLIPALGSVYAGTVQQEAPFFASALLCSAATPLLQATSLAYVASASRLRHATLVLAAWAMGLDGLSYPVLLRLWWLGRPMLLIIFALGCTVAGFKLFFASRDLHRSLFERSR